MPDDKIYYVWRGHNLTRLEYFLLKEEIVADYIVEDAIQKTDYSEALSVIDKIKKSSYNRNK